MASTSSIFSRPAFVRALSPSAASCGWGSECTVKPKGSSSRRGLAAWDDELEPDIEDGDQRANGPPLKSVAVIFFTSAAGPWPVAKQPLRSRAVLFHRQLQEGQSGLGTEGFQ